MPEEEVVEEHQDSSAEDTDAESAFDSVDEGGEVKEDPSKEDEPVEEEPAEEENESAEDKQEEEAPEKEEEKEEEPEEGESESKIAARAKELGLEGDQEKAAESGAAAEPPEGDGPPPARASGGTKISEEIVGNLDNLLGADEFPEGNLKVGDGEIDIRKYASDYPEDFNVAKVVGGVIAARIINSYVAQGALVTSEQADELNNKVDNILFWREVEDAHPGHKQISNSPEFKAWLEKAPATTQKLAKNLDSPDDAVLVLNSYKEHQAKEKVKEHDAAALARKDKKKKLHGDKTRPTSKTKGSSQDDVAAFESFTL